MVQKTQKKEDFLPVSVLYGLNSDAKTNVLEALHIMHTEICLELLHYVVALYNNFGINKYGADPYLKTIIDWNDINV